MESREGLLTRDYSNPFRGHDFRFHVSFPECVVVAGTVIRVVAVVVVVCRWALSLSSIALAQDQLMAWCCWQFSVAFLDPRRRARHCMVPAIQKTAIV